MNSLVTNDDNQYYRTRDFTFFIPKPAAIITHNAMLITLMCKIVGITF